jgi:signal peptidase I
MKRFFGSFVFRLMVSITLVMVVMQFFLVPTKVVMTSMYPTLDDGQYVVINSIPYVFQNPSRGDIVVFNHGDGNKLIKRIIGLPGECIDYRNGCCYINHKLFIENDDKSITDYNQDFPSTVNHEECKLLGDNQFFVIGDNRSVSLDSRAFGPIEKKDIIGKLIFKTPFGDK